jgi:hypothetical protein
MDTEFKRWQLVEEIRIALIMVRPNLQLPKEPMDGVV